MSAPIVFLDTETTGLSLDDDIWEFAAIRRDVFGAMVQVTKMHCFIEHAFHKCAALPEPFKTDHLHRYRADEALSQAQAARQIAELFADRPHVVGAVPNFDTERIARLLERFDLAPGWHYHLIDVENLAVGWLHGRYGPRDGGPPVEAEGNAVTLPWDSNELSAAVGVDPDHFERHTAMGDARWAMAIYDACTGGSSW